MQGLILEGNKYTNLKTVFKALKNHIGDYNWLITNYHCSNYPSSKIKHFAEYSFIEGNELLNIINDNNIQFIFGVFSAFDKNTPLNDILKYEFPYADGYKGFWQKSLKIQHPLAKVELVSWDAELILLITNNTNFLNSFKTNFKQAEDLIMYNEKI